MPVALGLTLPTRVELKTTIVTLHGTPGGATQGRVVLSTAEKRPIYAHAQADQSWLSVGTTEYRGNQAVIPLSVTRIPACSGQTLRAELSVQANGQQRFRVPIGLQIRPTAVTGVKSGGPSAFELPPLPNAALPPLPDGAGQKSDSETISLTEARIDNLGSRSRRRISCVCLLLSLLLLCCSAVLG